jgi:hypothetical protein
MTKLTLVAKSDNIELLKAALATIHSFDTNNKIIDSKKWNDEYHTFHSKAANPNSKSIEYDYLHLFTDEQNKIDIQFHNHSGGGKKIYLLPIEWNDYIAACKESLTKNIFKVGDWVTVKPEGFNSQYANHVKVGDTFQIGEISDSGLNDSGKWVSDASNNYCCMSFLRPATEKEIIAATQIKIAGYVVEVKNEDNISFGCQIFTKTELIAYRRLLVSPIEGTLTIGETKITSEIIDKLLNKMK